jgi:hypothetical protein
MRFLGWNWVLSAWLLTSAFVLPHTALSLAATAIAAFLTLTVAAFAAGHPAVRYANALVACGLFALALLGGMPTGTAVHNAVLAAAIFALSLVSPLHVAADEKPALAGGR